MSNLFDESSLAMIPTAYKDGKLYSVRPVPEYGAEEVTNGDFAADSNWLKDTGWTISGGLLNCNNSTSNNTRQLISGYSTSKKYRVTFTVSNYVSGGAVIYLGYGVGTTRTANGTYIEDLSFADSGAFNGYLRIFSSGASQLSIDNVSIQEIVSSGDFTFSRGSNLSATRVNASQLIEKGRENVLLQSNSFSTSPWDLSSINATSGQSGYDGTNDAWLIEKTGPNARVFQNKSQSGVQTFSVYVKKASSDYVRIFIDGINTNVFFNLIDGSVYTANLTIDKYLVDIGNGWWRIVVVANGSGTRYRIYPAEAGDTSSSTGSIYIQDSQLESSLVATPYIETGATTAQAGILENTPRLDYSGGATCPSLLLEPSRTNQCTQSEYIGSIDWNQGGITRSLVITQTSETNPEGASICWKIQGTASDNQLANNSSTNSGTTITNSVYVKRVSGTSNVLLRDVNNNDTSFSLSVADGWKRIDVTATATSATARFYLNLLDFNDEILVWGVQQEQGSYPTSYIPTNGVSQTRALDSCGATSATDIINQNEGTLFVDFIWNGKQDNIDYYHMAIIDVFNQNEIRLGGYNTALYGRVYSGGTLTFAENYKTGATKGQRYKVIIKYGSEGVKTFANGQLKDSGTPTLPTGTMSQIRLTRSGVGTQSSNNQSLYFPTALSDVECIALTTI